MIHSMTGFGRAEGVALGRETVVEIRSVNNRFRDVITRMPKSFNALEEKIKKLAAEYVTRGRLEISIQLGESVERQKRLKLDLDLARTYRDLLLELRDELGLSGDLTLERMAEYRDIIQYEEEKTDLDEFMAALKPIVQEALDNLVKMRQTEGNTLAEDFFSRLNDIGQRVAEIDSRRGVVVDETKAKLQTRIETLTQGVDLDEQRLAQEVAFIIDRGDITEELVRLGSHLDQFRLQVEAEEAVGRRLDFLLQEINREVNTIGSKSSDVNITGLVVDIKTELEKIREQVQNVE
jgi:uncharacterized protein (TIGR00255 family)